MPDFIFSGEGEQLKVSIGGDFKLLTELRGLAPGMGRKLCFELAKSWTFMANANKDDLLLPKLFYKSSIENEATFFGGSFNPWHEGHRACLDLCPSKNIIVIPDANPFKEQEWNKNCPWEQYLDLCLELADTPYSVYPGFCGMEKANPTVNWLPSVQLDKKSLLLGDDNFLTFYKWKNFEELLKSIDTLYTTPRQVDKAELEKVKDFLLEKRPELKIQFLEHHDYEDVSSSQIREERERLKNP